jgi:hypothetical protein
MPLIPQTCFSKLDLSTWEEDCEFDDNLNYIVKPCLKNKNLDLPG